MCEHLSPNHNLSYALTAGLPGKLSWVRRQAGGCPRSSAMKIFYVKIICRAVVKQFDPYWLKIAPVWFGFGANLSTSVIYRRCEGDPLEQIAECCQFQPASTSQVGRRDMRTRLYPLLDFVFLRTSEFCGDVRVFEFSVTLSLARMSSLWWCQVNEAEEALFLFISLIIFHKYSLLISKGYMLEKSIFAQIL